MEAPPAESLPESEYLVVCRGNINRSVAGAEFLRRALQAIDEELTEIGESECAGGWRVISRGVQGTEVDPQPVTHPNITGYPDMYNDAKPALEQLNIEQALTQHTSQPIDAETAARASVILAADGKTYTDILALYPGCQGKVYLLTELVGEKADIADPEGVSGAERMEWIFTTIRDVVTKGIDVLFDLELASDPELTALMESVRQTAPKHEPDPGFKAELWRKISSRTMENAAYQPVPDQ